MTVVTKSLVVPAPSAPMDCFVAYPAEGERFPLVILLMDIWGLREELYEMARRVAREGYFCVLPNLFYRHGKLTFQQRTPDGKAASFEALTPEKRKQMLSYAHQTVRESTREDLSAILAAAKTWPIGNGPAATVGFCMGGRAAFYANQEFPKRFLANACLHGTQLASDKPFSAHTKIAAMTGEFYCGFGEFDEQGSAAVRDALQQLFDKNSAVKYHPVVHIGAHHGYSMPDRDVHDRAATDADWRDIFAMLRRQLR